MPVFLVSSVLMRRVIALRESALDSKRRHHVQTPQNAMWGYGVTTVLAKMNMILGNPALTMSNVAVELFVMIQAVLN